ncbi:MAG: hypothetical protein NZ533_09255 [Casimicrobiaceae bacterium]|nr:hypothetical protein [Casimicrobiaceae bacterium]
MKAALAQGWLLVLAILAGCGPSAEEQARARAKTEAEEALQRLEQATRELESAANKGAAEVAAVAAEAAKALGAVAKAVTGHGLTGSFEPIDFRRLREVLPKELPGFDKPEASGERKGAFGIMVSEASYRFRSGAGDRHVVMKILDPGTLTGPYALTQAWLGFELDRETPEGFERTRTVAGQRIHERWEARAQRAQIKTVVGGRFIVEIESKGLPFEEARRLLARVDLPRLEAMKHEGRKS